MFRSPFFADMVALRDSLDTLANDQLSGPFRTIWSRTAEAGKVAQPMPLDVYATDDRAVILASVPGMRPEQLELTIHQNTVTFSGTIGNVAETEEAKGATWYLHELSSGTFRRSVTLPFPVDADKADATFTDGILRVVLPKAETAKPRRIAVNAGAPAGAIVEGATAE